VDGFLKGIAESDLAGFIKTVQSENVPNAALAGVSGFGIHQ
jgi:hypothetical protein